MWLQLLMKKITINLYQLLKVFFLLMNIDFFMFEVLVNFFNEILLFEFFGLDISICGWMLTRYLSNIESYN